MAKPVKKDIEKGLRAYHKQYERTKARIQRMGFICRGSITERWQTCGTPNCGCHKDPKKRHGPYYQLSWKEKGKTVSHYLSPEQVHTYREWMDNRRMLMDLIDQMESISRKAGDCIRSIDNPKNTPSEKAKKTGKKTT